MAPALKRGVIQICFTTLSDELTTKVVPVYAIFFNGVGLLTIHHFSSSLTASDRHALSSVILRKNLPNFP